MVTNGITRGGAARRASLLLVASAAVALMLSACGGSGDAATSVDKAADAEILNGVLARETAAVAAYDRVLPLLGGDALTSAREYRAQEQEHIDAIVKALRGLGEKARAEVEEIESEDLRSQADALGFLYEVESVSVANGLRAISNLTASWPRSLIGSIAANQAQHLAALRRALGASPADSIPEAFEDGTTPGPSEKMPE